MSALSPDLSGLVGFTLDEAALARLQWRPYGKGVSLAKLAREEDAGLVLYKVEAGAPKDAFARHRHPGGEAYLVLKGVIGDEHGRYPAGSVVWLPEDTVHTPWAEGRRSSSCSGRAARNNRLTGPGAVRALTAPTVNAPSGQVGVRLPQRLARFVQRVARPPRPLRHQR
jgi:anti-sigma factor ChrR (cupin superfamily)